MTIMPSMQEPEKTVDMWGDLAWTVESTNRDIDRQTTWYDRIKK